jgi:hypothetical protein
VGSAQDPTDFYEEGCVCGEEFLDEEGKRILGRLICMVENIKTIL